MPRKNSKRRKKANTMDTGAPKGNEDGGWTTAPILDAVPTTSATVPTNPFTFPSPTAPTVSLSIPLPPSTTTKEDADEDEKQKPRRGAINPHGAAVYSSFPAKKIKKKQKTVTRRAKKKKEKMVEKALSFVEKTEKRIVKEEEHDHKRERWKTLWQ